MVLKEREAAPDPVFKSEDYPFKNTVLREAALPPALKIELLEVWQRYRNFKGPFSTRGRVPMDLWVVNDTIRRVQDAGCSGPFRGPRCPDPRGSGGVLASRASAGQRRLSARESDRVGGGRGLGSEAIWNRSNARAGDRGGARAGKPRWARIFAMTGRGSMAAMIVKVPPYGDSARCCDLALGANPPWK